MQAYLPEEGTCISLHPAGFQVLVGAVSHVYLYFILRWVPRHVWAYHV